LITASTRVAGVIGDPVTHSLSPVVHNAAFAALGLDWVYVAFEVADGNAPAAVQGMRSLRMGGLNVTMPHKQAVIGTVDRLTPTAERLQSVNTISWRGNQLVGDSTDGAGFVDALRHDEGFDPRGRRAVVLGAGGAARAVVHALANAGAAHVTVLNRTPERAVAAAALAPPGIVDSGAIESAGDALADADIVVNATPIGMAGTADADGLPVDPESLRAGQVVVDLVYHPLRTALLDAARERGCIAVTGLGTLIHQAAHAFRQWTGEDPPLEVMSAAAMAALRHGT
jgi:shikimate dehydrogenase